MLYTKTVLYTPRWSSSKFEGSLKLQKTLRISAEQKDSEQEKKEQENREQGAGGQEDRKQKNKKQENLRTANRKQ